ncbi:MAG: exosortase T [Candidatus Thiodiazotropha sp.]
MLALSISILAIDPVRWLINTWLDPSYDSDGLWVFLVFSLLLLWSLTSPRKEVLGRYQRRALMLLATTAMLRLAGQVLAIHILSALALVVDVYALGLILGLQQRQRPLSPLWMALLFACSLPLERILQRTLGYGLQQLSAETSCSLLTSLDAGISCQGTRIQLPTESLLIDLPCSGASALVLMTILLCALMAFARPSRRQGMAAVWIMLSAAWISNSLRILILALGVLYPVPNVDLMQQPWHELVGLFSLLPGFALLIFYFLLIGRTGQHQEPITALKPMLQNQSSNTAYSHSPPIFGAMAFFLLVLLIVSLTPHPVDSSEVLDTPYAPRFLAGEVGQVVPLLDKERHYFERFGGAAIKMQYAERSLLITQTQSPLRHLHAPDECLRGLGFSVNYIGSHASLLPTAVYRAQSPDGRVWRVSVSFISSSGKTTTHVGEAVWHWFQSPESWMAIQRIAPWNSPTNENQDWDQHLFAALDIHSIAIKPLHIALLSLNPKGSDT